MCYRGRVDGHLQRHRRPRSPLTRGALCLLLAGALPLLATACGPPQEGEAGTILPTLAVDEVGPAPVVPGTELYLRGEGFLPPEVAELSVRFDGLVEGGAVDITVGAPQVVRIDDQTLRVAVTDALADALIQPAGRFAGDIIVTRTASGGSEDARLGVDLEVDEALTPALDDFAPRELYPGDVLTLEGANFLHPSEGFSLVRFDGVFTVSSPPTERVIQGLVIPAIPSAPDTRDVLELVLTPDIFGIRPGRFDGSVSVLNQASSGTETESNALDLDGVSLRRPVLEEVTPTAASRGQRIRFIGRGLLAPDELLQASSLLVLEGTFDPLRGPTLVFEGASALALFPESNVGNTELSVVLRVDRTVDGELEGLGRDAGVFAGTVTPVLLAGPDTVLGTPLVTTFTVKLATQVVFVKLLPAFDEALTRFGLLAEREGVIARMLEVNARDYEGINVTFAMKPPEDFVEYAVVELGGADPNGTGLFGLDNTAGKDIGNVRFDDVIGGFNAETRARGYAAYGGIFVSEFMNFSPSLSDSELASPRFDEIFGPFSPELGGTPAEEGELAAGGARADAIDLAVTTLGNLVGSTVTHEVGHSLGLTAIDGQFHNQGDNPGWIMDAGVFRPFEERAELDGQGPGEFSPFNREYLEFILPVQE